MEKETFYQLIDRYQAGTATPEEQVLLETYYHQLTQGRTELEPQEELRLRTVVLDKILAKTFEKSVPMFKRVWIRYAAAAVFLFAIVTTYFLISGNKKSTPSAIAFKGDVAAPVINKATLTLANGKQIILDSVGQGSLAAEGAGSANKTGDGSLSYNNKADVVEFHTLTNPKGSKPVQLTLADGSVVWLNVASSITFPTAFNGTERSVTMTGEAYFEVKHNVKQPFRVKAGNQIIEDLGTVFNVNAYADEPSIKTTLIEGSVKINSAVLKPGEQYANGMIEKANIEQALAWKNGLFSFDQADIHTVMRQLSRWYDVEVRFEGKIDNAPFQGDIGRSLSLAQVLKGLEQMHVHFRIEEDKRIVILP